MKKKLLFLVLLLCSMAMSVQMKARDKEFWFAPPAQINGSGNSYMGHGGFVFTNPTNLQATVNIEYYKNRSRDTTIIIPAYSYDHCYYTTKAEISSIVEELTTANHGNPNFSGAVHITSNVGILVYYISDYMYLQETYLLKGSAALGTEFNILGAKGGTRTSNSGMFIGNANSAYISIAGTEDGTNLSID